MILGRPQSCLGILAACLVLSAPAWAQNAGSPDGATYVPGTFNRPYYGGGGGYYGGGGGWGWGGMGGWNGVGSTAGGSYLAGMGMAIRAQGQYNLDTSAAAINLEEARKRDIENRKLWTNTYFEMRRINQAYRDSQRGPPAAPETWVRLAQNAAPNRLSASSLDPVTGAINWPTGLMEDMFKDDRAKLEKLFAERALAHGAIGIDGHAQIRSTINQMLENLRSRIRDFNTRVYMDARGFLNSLAFEASSPGSNYATARAE